MKSLVYMTTRIPSKLVADPATARYYVYEAFDLSEVLHLCEHQDILAVVNAADVEDSEVIELQMHRITIS